MLINEILGDKSRQWIIIINLALHLVTVKRLAWYCLYIYLQVSDLGHNQNCAAGVHYTPTNTNQLTLSYLLLLLVLGSNKVRMEMCPALRNTAGNIFVPQERAKK